ncbi:MAG: helix-turn-helix domain-containing protein [Actinobacteria bacterium]|nr:helix-turn-helix domain-containing protein [Actinomycetota bacterium]MBU4392685.1 helix-turn-helix domain-containing protein [Actinomycetota bacterium]MBU4401695.1 helix-turn-helix domain-containing protein [Actinomycetota bacterium]MBU4441402.1 helix-turn-helix domain-containing protein [Actinomycetota bacterium]MCG2819930.1 helix-turn-helix domain-containing protein [Actinomycetes bacterium]
MDRVIELVTIEEAARDLRVSTGTLWRFVRNGKITPSQMGGHYVISRMQLMFFAQNHASKLSR